MKFKYTQVLLAILSVQTCFSQIPVLNSSPGIIDKVIYLDFDGQKVVGTSWNSGNLINAAASSASQSEIIEIWKRVSEDYRPFNVNVTTDSVKFNNATPNKRMRVVFTPTSGWYTSPAGGVAFLGSFAWGGTPGTPCWVFENQLGFDTKSMAEAASHETGHTLSLQHQSTYNSSCVKTNEYNPGFGSGVTSWAPIMGVGYSDNVTIWHNGPNAVSCNNIQNDHGGGNPGITGAAYLSYLPDDVGNTFTSAKILNLTSLNMLDSGIITQPTDLDAYRFTICNSRYVTFSVKPFALDTFSYQGANLDIRLHIYDASSNLLALDTTLTRLHALRGLNLAPGSYYFTVDGGRSANYSDYGSLGKYYIRIRATNPQPLASSVISPAACAGQSITLNSTSIGTPQNWTWTVSSSSATTTFTVQNPVINFAAGAHTISLLTSNSTATSCPFTQTLNVGSPPSIAILGGNSVLCLPRTATLTAFGATSYTWMPGVFNGSTYITSPSATTNYTIRGSNAACTSSIITTLTVVPNFNLSLAASKTLACFGETLSLTGSGASSYTLNPGNINSSVTVLTPSVTSNYTLAGSVGACVKTSSVKVTVIPDFTLTASSSQDIVCAGGQVLITSSGASDYTLYPSGLTGSPILYLPVATADYTIVGATDPKCRKAATFQIVVDPCDVGIDVLEQTRSLIFPNPVKEQLHVVLEKECETLSLYSISGESIRQYPSGTAHDVVIDVKDLARGVYFLKIGYTHQGPQYHKIILE